MNFKFRKTVEVKKLPCRRFVLFFMFVSLAFVAGCFGDEDEKAAEQQAVPVKVYKVTEQSFPVKGEYVAQIEAKKTVEIRSRVEGYLKARHFDEGQIVTKGQLLFVIDPRPYEETLKQAEAELARSVATLNKANTDYKRFKTLFDQGAVSRDEFDTRVTDKQVLEAQLNNAKSSVKQASLNVDFTSIYAPMEGIIGKTQVNLGALVAKESSLLATVSAVDPVYVNFSIPEKEYLFAIKEIEEKRNQDLPARSKTLRIILADGKFYDHNGTFSMADRAVDPSTGTLSLRAVFPNPEKMLRDGQYAKIVALLKEFQNALVVPARAILDVQGRKSILTVSSNGTVVENAVTIDYSNDQSAVIGKGIKDGDLIIADGVNKIRPGTLVAPEIVTPKNTK
ncbi:membrane fusion protein, multidrug efflux system [Maridesulfovibrio ferrireducens]|uniref:Membrane fusion protein, multidrug efflux system n=1 Tax=Maridesulfovibrio ferrireducens TaxID=246191 RepID=A0A1G9KNB7_9BACT|nr:efflux RND transporter periplasmic adaptor subunit [Maridesulfovibrio ferrireducens]SDL51004.1 membrane fusion protein, multidrug efflux system [Maridesulfovibrio ferrireducens]